MMKMIYAVKSGRKTGIYKELPKCFGRTNQYPNEKYCSFEYLSELEEEPEDVSGSLRYAIKEAKIYLGDLVYLGESADYLEDVSWVEDGFLPFGYESEEDNLEPLSDIGEQEEEEDREEEHDEWLVDNRNTYDVSMESWDVADVDKALGEWSYGNIDTHDASILWWSVAGVKEELGEWLADNINTYDASMESWDMEIEYWKIAEDMRKCIALIRYGSSDTEKKTGADNLRRHLDNCLADANLSDLTVIYKGKRANNAIGYNPNDVVRFVSRMLNRYPKS